MSIPYRFDVATCQVVWCWSAAHLVLTISISHTLTLRSIAKVIVSSNELLRYCNNLHGQIEDLVRSGTQYPGKFTVFSFETFFLSKHSFIINTYHVLENVSAQCYRAQ